YGERGHRQIIPGLNTIAPRGEGSTPAPYRRLALTLAAPPTSAAASWDLLRWPILGPFLRWRHTRPVLQFLLFLLALAVILDGPDGPPASPMNLAGVLPWIHWRGLVVLGLLAAGNLFCLACPFTLPRRLARRWLPRRRPWPRRLGGKWPAVGLLLLFF